MNKLINQAQALNIEGRAFINGAFRESSTGDWLIKESPALKEPITSIASCGVLDVDVAVDCAKTAYETNIWRDVEPSLKKTVLFKLADLMYEHREELSLLDTLETGRAYKNYFEDSIPKAIEALRYFSEAIDKYYDYCIPPRAGTIATVCREPLGVIGIITPWNDPLVVAIWKLAPALLMGNSVIIKPAEQSTYSILKVAALAKEAGIPDGVLNVLPGKGEVVGEALALHSKVSGIFFTGSSDVGKKILEYAGRSNMKKIGLECGGKSPFIVTKNCRNLRRAAKVLAHSMFYNQGQICSAPSRAIIHSSIKDRFVKYLKAEMEHYLPSDPFDPRSVVGCVVSKQQMERIETFIEEGNKVSLQAYSLSEKMHYKKGYCVPPTLFEVTDHSLPIVQEEIFGPVLVLQAFNITDEAIDFANSTRYGLAAAVWTNDYNEAHSISRALQAGIVHVNSYGSDDNSVPFGGIKESGIGKDKSIIAFDEYSYLKTTWMSFDT